MLVKNILAIVFILLTATLKAQEMQYSQYQHTPFSTNSGMPGASSDFQVTLNYRNQPLSSGDKITTTTLSASYPLLNTSGRRYGGIGIAVMNDNAASFFKTTNIMLGGAYNFAIGSTQLSWGIEGGFAQKQFDADGLITASQLNNGILNGNGGENFNNSKSYALLSSGVYWYKDDADNNRLYFLGVNASNINKPEVAYMSGIQNKIPAAFTAVGGIRAFQKNNFSVYPTFRIVTAAGNTVTNAGAWFGYAITEKSKLTAGTLYNTNQVLNASLEYTTSGFFVNAGYDCALASAAKVWQGNSTELHIGYKKTINRGVKDLDGDGVPDKTDECPSEPGLKRFNGCPDTDNDGVPDKDDVCVSLAGVIAFNGCPDTDGDGVPDSKDQCVAQAGPVELNGCPDRDKDGVPDLKDQCPDEAGLAELQGCSKKADKEEKLHAEEPVAENNVRSSTLQKENIGQLTFEINSSVIDKHSFNYLDTIMINIGKESRTQIVIEGHTDSEGSAQLNMTLSSERAESVKRYFVAGGIQTERITVKGYGETMPLNSNDTREGKQKNRRAEIYLIR